MSKVEKVAIVGADGSLGPQILDNLLSHGFEVTVLKRATSKSSDNYPEGVKIEKWSGEMNNDELVTALKGQDALIVTTRGADVETQKRFGDAAVKAGIKRLIPADFGSCDSSTEWSQRLVPLYKTKTQLREYLMVLAEKHEGFSWTAIVPGHFVDWDPSFIHMWPKEKRATILDDGETKHSLTTLAKVGEATAKVLQKLPETANKTLYVQSFCVTQNQLLKAFEDVTGSRWEVKKVDSGEFERQEKARADGGDKQGNEELVWMLGTLDANWEKKDSFAMKLLDLQEDDLHEVAKTLAEKWSTS